MNKKTLLEKNRELKFKFQMAKESYLKTRTDLDTEMSELMQIELEQRNWEKTLIDNKLEHKKFCQIHKESNESKHKMKIEHIEKLTKSISETMLFDVHVEQLNAAERYRQMITNDQIISSSELRKSIVKLKEQLFTVESNIIEETHRSFGAILQNEEETKVAAEEAKSLQQKVKSTEIDLRKTEDKINAIWTMINKKECEQVKETFFSDNGSEEISNLQNEKYECIYDEDAMHAMPTTTQEMLQKIHEQYSQKDMNSRAANVNNDCGDHVRNRQSSELNKEIDYDDFVTAAELYNAAQPN